MRAHELKKKNYNDDRQTTHLKYSIENTNFYFNFMATLRNEL